MAHLHVEDYTSTAAWSLCWVCHIGWMRCEIDTLECDLCGHQEGVA